MRVFTGDDKGQIKSVACEISGSNQQDPARISVTTLEIQNQTNEPIHKLKCYREPGQDFGIVSSLDYGLRYCF